MLLLNMLNVLFFFGVIVVCVRFAEQQREDTDFHFVFLIHGCCVWCCVHVFSHEEHGHIVGVIKLLMCF